MKSKVNKWKTNFGFEERESNQQTGKHVDKILLLVYFGFRQYAVNMR